MVKRIRTNLGKPTLGRFGPKGVCMGFYMISPKARDNMLALLELVAEGKCEFKGVHKHGEQTITIHIKPTTETLVELRA